MKIFSVGRAPLLALVLAVAGCAHPYTLDLLGEKGEDRNGLRLATLDVPDCLLEIGYQYSNPWEMLVHVRLLNKRKKPTEIDVTSFAMTGSPETMKTSPLSASEPEKYLKELRGAAEVLEARTRMESYQGVQELDQLKGEKSDASIDAANDAYNRKLKEAKTAQEQAAAIRSRIAAIEPVALRNASVKPGESAEGALIFKAAFGETGVVAIESTLPGCSGRLKFMLKK